MIHSVLKGVIGEKKWEEWWSKTTNEQMRSKSIRETYSSQVVSYMRIVKAAERLNQPVELPYA